MTPLDSPKGTGPRLDEAALEAAAAWVARAASDEQRWEPTPWEVACTREALAAYFAALDAQLDDVITVYRRMKAACAGARAERDIMREAVEEATAQAALNTDLARRKANLGVVCPSGDGSPPSACPPPDEGAA